MAAQRSLMSLLLFCLLCGSSLAAAKRRYLSVSMEDLHSSKAHVDCPPFKMSVTSSGDKVTIPAACGWWPPPKCCSGGDSIGRDVLNHDLARVSTLVRRNSPGAVLSSAAGTGTAAAPWYFPGQPPVAPPAEAPAVTIPDSSGAYLNTLEFVVTVGFGTPAHPYTVSFDTGSDVSWIQCQPCSGHHCYRQHDPIFDSSKSSSYSAVGCGGPQCAAAGGACNGTTCMYKVKYGDGSSTAGVLSRETLTLTSSRTLPGFVFGCGNTNLGHFGNVDGLIGLGRGQLSLASQAAATFGGTFSYCLPSANGAKPAGYLTIGSAPVSGQVQYTAMVQKQQYPSFYFVELVSIDIGGYVLPVPPTVFTSTGTLLDSGTVLTYLPSEAYTALRDRFRFTMKGYVPAPPYGDVLDTCYNFAGQSAIVIPAVSFKFSDGAVFDLDFFGILMFPEKPDIGCLGFAAQTPGMPFTIVGNTQQRNTEVIYDVGAEMIGFVPSSCF